MKKLIFIFFLFMVAPVFSQDNYRQSYNEKTGVGVSIIGREDKKSPQQIKNESAAEKPIEVSNLNVKITRYGSPGYVYFAVKADITNKGDSKNVFVGIQGVDFEGYERKLLFLSGYIESGTTKLFTEESIMLTSEFNKIREWRVKD